LTFNSIAAFILFYVILDVRMAWFHVWQNGSIGPKRAREVEIQIPITLWQDERSKWDSRSQSYSEMSDADMRKSPLSRI